MGFALWMKDGLSWAQGTHEYRPMGVAIVSSSDHFRPRDFDPTRRNPSRDAMAFEGFFASIGHLNQHLERARSRPFQKSRRRTISRGAALA